MLLQHPLCNTLLCTFRTRLVSPVYNSSKNCARYAINDVWSAHGSYSIIPKFNVIVPITSKWSKCDSF